MQIGQYPGFVNTGDDTISPFQYTGLARPAKSVLLSPPPYQITQARAFTSDS